MVRGALGDNADEMRRLTITDVRSFVAVKVKGALNTPPRI
jgi:hypothetical protein